MIFGLLRIVNSCEPFQVLDDVYFNKNIRCFDTANCYGRSENIFGEWMVSRIIDRNNVYIICKGGHHSYNGDQIIHRINQQDVVHDLNESFKRLQISYADSFMFHRDDENVPPEVIYDICVYLLESKICNKIGVSNWKTSRIEDVNTVSKNRIKKPIIEESQIFLNYIQPSHDPYANIHMIDYSDYLWYTRNPEHKIQIYSVACFVDELENNPIHQNKIFKSILDYLCDFTNESKQTILYVLLSKAKGLHLECIQGSISPNHILSQSKIDEIYLRINNKNSNLADFIPCFLAKHPIGIPENNMLSFLQNGFVGPFILEDIPLDKIESIQKWVVSQEFHDYGQMKNHHENHHDIKEVCLSDTIHEIITKYIGYECICYSTEFFLRQNNDDFQYTVNWHTDPYLNLDPNFPHFTLQIGLTDNDETNCLSAVRGSHLFDYQNKFKTIDKNNTFAPLIDFEANGTHTDLIYKLLNKKAYVYLFSNYLTHGKGSIQNHDNPDVRLALTMRIISKQSVLKRSSPHHHDHPHDHVSKDIFTLGSSNIGSIHEEDTLFSELLWNIVQKHYKSMFTCV